MFQEVAGAPDHHPKIPPFDRLSIDWSGKSNSIFVFSLFIVTVRHLIESGRLSVSAAEGHPEGVDLQMTFN
jgi:hypothetical protein